MQRTLVLLLFVLLRPALNLLPVLFTDSTGQDSDVVGEHNGMLDTVTDETLCHYSVCVFVAQWPVAQASSGGRKRSGVLCALCCCSCREDSGAAGSQTHKSKASRSSKSSSSSMA